MAGWLARTISNLTRHPSAPSAEPLPPAELRETVEAAKRLLSEGNAADARVMLLRAATSNPDDADTLAQYGVAAHSVGDSADARAALARAVQIDPGHLIAQKGLAAACYALGDMQGLEVAARTAVRLAPRDREALTLFGQA